jgi:hypothetical protein
VNAMRSLTTTSMSLTTTLSPMMNFSNCLHDNWDGVDKSGKPLAGVGRISVRKPQGTRTISLGIRCSAGCVTQTPCMQAFLK